MKILTREEEEAHYSATVKGGILGGLAGLGCGAVSVVAASRRFHLINHLTLPMKAFLVTSSGTFSAIIAADRSSRSFELSRHPDQQYRDENVRLREELEAGKSTYEKAKIWGKENRYGIVGASWVASMGIALGLVGRNPYLSGTQKLVQARVYAQGLTLLVLVATAAFEIGDKNKGEGRYETVRVLDPKDPTHKRIIEKQIHHESYAGEDQWKDMIEAEERRMNERKEHAQEAERHHEDQQHKSDKSKLKPDTKGGKAGKRGSNEDEDGAKDGSKKTTLGGVPRPPSLP